MMKYVLLTLLFVLHLFCACVRADEKIRIGVSTALSGDAATFGTDVKNAVAFANDELAGGRYQLVIEDDQCDPKKAVNIARKFVAIDRLKYVIGSVCSSCFLPMASVFERSKVVAISPVASAPSISQAGDYIFRTALSDKKSGRLLFDYVVSHHRNFGVISELSEFTQGFVDAFSAGNQDGRINILKEDFASTETDFRSMLVRLRAKGVDGLFINTNTEASLLLVLRQVNQLKIEIPIYAAYNPSSRAFLEKAGLLANGIIYVDFPELDSIVTAEGKQLFAKFVASYGKPHSLEIFVHTTIEAFRALHEAIQSGKDVRQYLYTTKFRSTLGEWRFDENGDIDGVGFALKIINNGRPQVLQ